MKSYTSIIFIQLIICLFASCKKDDSPAPVYTIPPPLTGKTYSATELAGFKQITIHGAYNDEPTIKKLPKTTLIYLVDTIYPRLTRELDSIINDVNFQTDSNLVLKRTRDSAASQIRVYLTDRATYEAVEPRAANSFNTSSYELDGLCVPYWGSHGDLYLANVFVDMQRLAGDSLSQIFILRHEIMHSFGFLGHVSLTDYTSSILFYYRLLPPTLSYSYFDKRMLKLLYNPAIKQGMDEQSLDSVLVNL